MYNKVVDSHHYGGFNAEGKNVLFSWTASDHRFRGTVFALSRDVRPRQGSRICARAFIRQVSTRDTASTALTTSREVGWAAFLL